MKIHTRNDGYDKVVVEMKDRSKASTKALRSTLNKVAKSSRAMGAKIIKDDYNIKTSAIRKSISLTLATNSRLVAEIAADNKSVSLMNFKARKTRKGVSYSIKKNGKREEIIGAFIAHQKNKGSGESISKAVFKRLGKKRLPIIKQAGPSMAQIFLSLEMISKINEHITKELPGVYKHEFDYYSK